ncbi:hypothetical protein JAAARDRAFT_161175 [Jaapia argillacea MUCL 33604]|uniref:AMP-dependent synthetase/ligase domain-containing protein n=1 Tax=Jaapia argillacea MUCL 33604 TaxID=933084 RepID=A0A067PRA8_9AGAM|nr:hypothetical protein JAAARDRAFT_161175 [Jaapia argillacea MUCL 33604]
MKNQTVHVSPHESCSLPETSVYTHLFDTHFDKHPGSSAAFIDALTGRTITRSQLRDFALQWAYGVLHVFPTHPKHQGTGIQVQRGDTVCIFSPNSLAYPVILHGAVAAGLRVSPANSGYTPPELAHQYVDSRSKLVFVHPALLPTALKMFELVYGGASKGLEEAKKRVVVVGGHGWGSLPPQEEEKGLAAVQQHWRLDAKKAFVWIDDLLGKGTLSKVEQFTGQDIHETVYLCYSSGTTGKPKGVETTHINIATILHIIEPVWPKLVPGEDVMLGVLPFYHIYGLAKLLHHPIYRGIPVVIMPRFDPVGFCANVEKYKVTMSLIVPPILVLLANHPAVDKYNMTTMRILFSGAAPLGRSLVDKVRERFKKLGIDVVVTQGYGLTETSPTTHLLPAEHSLRKCGSIGVLLPNLEARLVDDDERDVSQAQAKTGGGELWVRGPTVMKGYLNNPSATTNSVTKDGWFKTGDIAVRDDEGFYWIVDRKKELIKYKGFQVPPAELEAILLVHPDIVDSAVIGVNNKEQATELPRAYVVHRDPSSLRTDKERAEFGKSVQDWIKTRVAKHKFLRGGVVVVDVIPKSAAGKILRRELRERAKKELTAEATTAKALL